MGWESKRESEGLDEGVLSLRERVRVGGGEVEERGGKIVKRRVWVMRKELVLF